MAALKEAARVAGTGDIRPHLLMGNLHQAAGRLEEASLAYQSALRAAPDACPLDLYLRLGACFLAKREYDFGHSVYLQVGLWQYI